MKIFRLKDYVVAAPRLPATRPAARRRDPFLAGPIPMSWLRRAAACRGSALLVGVELWHLKGLTKSSKVRLNMSTFAVRGSSRYAAARGLAALEGAGLVRCRRRPGCTPEVEILDISSGGGGGP